MVASSPIPTAPLPADADQRESEALEAQSAPFRDRLAGWSRSLTAVCRAERIHPRSLRG